jgi:hypothetical protein
VSLDASMIALIDQRIRANAQMTKAVGTCVERDPTGPGATVIFDGSTVAMPVKVLGHVFLQPGFRCVLDKYGTDWIVSGSFAAMGLGEASSSQFPATTGGLTSSTYLDINELSPLTFTKLFDRTYVRFAMTASCYLNVGTDINRVRFALRVTGVETSAAYTATDYDLNYNVCDLNGEHISTHATSRTTTMPAGIYNVQARWRRTAGAGTLRANGDDLFTIEVDEGVRQLTPLL